MMKRSWPEECRPAPAQRSVPQMPTPEFGYTSGGHCTGTRACSVTSTATAATTSSGQGTRPPLCACPGPGVSYERLMALPQFTWTRVLRIRSRSRAYSEAVSWIV